MTFEVPVRSRAKNKRILLRALHKLQEKEIQRRATQFQDEAQQCKLAALEDYVTHADQTKLQQKLETIHHRTEKKVAKIKKHIIVS